VGLQDTSQSSVFLSIVIIGQEMSGVRMRNRVMEEFSGIPGSKWVTGPMGHIVAQGLLAMKG
jgi:hypothetical protein